MELTLAVLVCDSYDGLLSETARAFDLNKLKRVCSRLNAANLLAERIDRRQ